MKDLGGGEQRKKNDLGVGRGGEYEDGERKRYLKEETGEGGES